MWGPSGLDLFCHIFNSQVDCGLEVCIACPSVVFPDLFLSSFLWYSEVHWSPIAPAKGKCTWSALMFRKSAC